MYFRIRPYALIPFQSECESRNYERQLEADVLRLSRTCHVRGHVSATWCFALIGCSRINQSVSAFLASSLTRYTRCLHAGSIVIPSVNASICTHEAVLNFQCCILWFEGWCYGLLWRFVLILHHRPPASWTGREGHYHRLGRHHPGTPSLPHPPRRVLLHYGQVNFSCCASIGYCILGWKTSELVPLSVLCNFGVDKKKMTWI